jgi:hypothetical protein
VTMNSVALRVQRLKPREQVLLLLHMAQARFEGNRAAPRDVEQLFDDLALPVPTRVSNVLAGLESEGLVSRRRGKGRVWAVSPEGRRLISEFDFASDLASLTAEVVDVGSSRLGGALHPLLPPSLAPSGVAPRVGSLSRRAPL